MNSDHLIEARTKKGWSQADLATRAKVSQQTIWKLESGRASTSKYVARIAAALDVDVSYLDEDYVSTEPARVVVTEPMTSEQQKIPLFASAEGSNDSGSLIITSEAIDYVPRPYTLENISDAYGILIEGDSMEPAFEAGDVAWVNPVLGPRRGTDVILYEEEDNGDRRAVIKRLTGWDDTHWVLKQYNPERVFKLPRDPWRTCHRVIGKLSKR